VAIAWEEERYMMSTEADTEARADTMCCASCGIAEVDDIKLKKCPACDLVRYCSDNCQRDHRPKHEEICKKRAAELRDEVIFRQPESIYDGDCPICFLPLPIGVEKSGLLPCCLPNVCSGCFFANYLREELESLENACPFCRHPSPKSDKEANQTLMKSITKRVAANDPVALRERGRKHRREGDYESAFEYWKKAAELGDAGAHYNLSVMYRKGEGVEKDEKKELYHLEEAAIAGHPEGRFNLACYEGENKRFDRAVKHWIIGANLGCGASIQMLKELYVQGGDVSKEDFAAALRAHQAAVYATKSPNREKAAKAVGA
jgi:tetratricopeptide (TPR) repeat protein